VGAEKELQSFGDEKLGAKEKEKKLRLFAAVVPDKAVVSALDALVRGAWDSNAKVRCLDTVTWHVTLQFLGDVRAARLDDLRLACAYGAGRLRAFRIHFADAGAFPTERRARTVWLGLGKGREQLAALATALQGEMGKRGFLAEERPFIPHMTVGQLSAPSDVSVLAERLRTSISDAGIVTDVERVALVQSLMSEDGAQYEILDFFPLQS